MEPPLKSHGCGLHHLRQLARVARSLSTPNRCDPLIDNCRARRNGDTPSDGALTRFRADRRNGSRFCAMFSRFPVAGSGLARRNPRARNASLAFGVLSTRTCFCRPCPAPARAALSYRVRVWAFSAIRG